MSEKEQRVLDAAAKFVDTSTKIAVPKELYDAAWLELVRAVGDWEGIDYGGVPPKADE